MYLATLDCANLKPKLEQFAVNARRHPKSKFSKLICRINARSSVSICGRPPRERDFPAPIATKAVPMPAHQRLGTEDRDDLQDRRKPTIELDEKPAIVVRKLDPPSHLASQKRSADVGAPHSPSASSRLFDLNGRASTARTKQISATIRANLADSIAQ